MRADKFDSASKLARERRGEGEGKKRDAGEKECESWVDHTKDRGGRGRTKAGGGDAGAWVAQKQAQTLSHLSLVPFNHPHSTALTVSIFYFFLCSHEGGSARVLLKN